MTVHVQKHAIGDGKQHDFSGLLLGQLPEYDGGTGGLVPTQFLSGDVLQAIYGGVVGNAIAIKNSGGPTVYLAPGETVVFVYAATGGIANVVLPSIDLSSVSPGYTVVLHLADGDALTINPSGLNQIVGPNQLVGTYQTVVYIVKDTTSWAAIGGIIEPPSRVRYTSVDDITLLDSYVIITAAGTYTIPGGSAVGKKLHIKNGSTGSVTLAGNIDGLASITLQSQNDSVMLVWTGTEWVRF